MARRAVRWSLVVAACCALGTLVGMAPTLNSAAASSPATTGTTADAHARSEHSDFLRGMTVSCPTWGPVWGSPAMADTLAELRALGVEWIALHPYAGVGRDGSVRARSAADLDFLDRAVDYARDADVQLFWKPHLAYWGSFEWRGAITFGDDAAAWRRFFDGYRAFIVDQARFAQAAGVPLFSIGLEYEETFGPHEAEWRRLITEVRAVYDGRLTYSANWDRVTEVPIWDAVDLIGVQFYYPLSHEPEPSDAALEAGWDRALAELRTLSERHAKPVLFTEIGYDTGPRVAAEPWATFGRASGADRALRRRLMELAMRRAPTADFVEGMFWWKWIPNRSGTRDFPMESADARDVLRAFWTDDSGRAGLRTTRRRAADP
ncbi:MAG: hypothetical protein AAGN46_07195 [Acidobacteriota bacterium]